MKKTLTMLGLLCLLAACKKSPQQRNIVITTTNITTGTTLDFQLYAGGTEIYQVSNADVGSTYNTKASSGTVLTFDFIFNGAGSQPHTGDIDITSDGTNIFHNGGNYGKNMTVKVP